jgi:Ser-tRNA(Ala) deacylase AlaX
MQTMKLFHAMPFAKRCDATVINIDPEKGVVLDQSIAYPESGGQLGDTGELIIESEGVLRSIPFSDTQKGVGRVLMLNDFPSIPVETETFHKISEGDMSAFHIGQKVVVNINEERRHLLTASHSAIHLVLMGLETLYPGIYQVIKGCSIKPTGARLDFRMQEKFSVYDVNAVQGFVQNMIAMNKEMILYQHKLEPEAWYWKLDDYAIPCGGTHLKTTGAIGEVEVKKESLGKTMQRMSISFKTFIT